MKKKSKKAIKMSKKSFRKEHAHLVKVLKKGSKAQRAKEASKQKRELKKYK